MPTTPRQRYLKIALTFFSLILFANVIIAPQVRAIGAPVAVTADVPATVIATKTWLSEAWTYIRNKMATILFQNMLRKYINDLALDAAKYLAVGAKGQEKLYIEKKWGEHWNDIADQALGDFIETFANSVVSDIAANEIKNEGIAICEKQKQECLDRNGTDCEGTYKICLGSKEDKVALTACDDNYQQCSTNCSKLQGASETRNVCYATCATTRDACKINAQGSTERARQAPMFNGSNSPLAKINICNPSLEVGLIITLGLTQSFSGYSNDPRGTCSFTEMKKNWTNEFNRLKDIASPDFLKKVSMQFYPNASDLSIALTLHSNLIEYRGKQVADDKLTLTANKGYIDARNFAGNLLGTPQDAENRKKLADQKVWDNLGKITGDILVDAANIFLNQWAISSWTNLMSNLGTQSGSLSYWSGQQTGRQAIENKLSKLSEPAFAAGGRLDIIALLSTCPDPANPGPTDCVIGNEFSTAIEAKMTVIEAVRSGRLSGNWPFGFDKNGEDKIVYNQGYPYRSMIILRKYRVLPVGWEVAAQEIQRGYLDNVNAIIGERANGFTLNDMLACYSTTDTITGYSADWCKGLVDPNWVLKVPEYFCSRKGYGPNLVKEPDLMTTGVKYCSNDNGATRTVIEDKMGACATDDECCTETELLTKDRLMLPGQESALRNFTCGATCAYSEQKLLVNRNNDYCADEQGCLKEGRNGSCLFYGYCTEEKRSWVFNKERKDESCDPIFNTCQTFKAPTGKSVAYLANTLDYGCQQSAIGCKEYSYNGSYNAGDNTVNWDRAQSVYLNKKTGTCASKQEGCHEFIRVKDNNGVNLLADGGLEAFDKDRWLSSGVIVDNTGTDKVYQGGMGLKVPAGGRGVYYGPTDQSLLPGGFAFDADRIYTLSGYVYVVSGEVEMVMGNSANLSSTQTIVSTATGEWQNLVLSVLNDNATKANFFAIRGTTANTVFYVDNMKLEMGQSGEYSTYRSNNLLYEKFLPNYLEDVCYRDKTKDFNFKDNAPAKCSEFARKCQADEVGCELYTEVNTKDQTAAQIKPKDLCPGECVGYDTFIQQANNFYSARDEYFIPKTAKTCRASAVGCSMFVNLDTVPAGGEENKYFSNFRRCVKPTEANSNCAEFYTWEGSDESGYQLVVYQLQANTDNTSGISQPATVDDTDTTDNNDGATCNENVYALPYDSPQYNPDCRQFYGRDGNISYHVMAKTITCSKDCFSYRLTTNNIDVSITDELSCTTAKGHWDTDKQNCVVCINGGVWMDEHQACVYQADPGKSQTCSSSEVGCSEYEGDFGNQVRILFNDTFEGSGLGGWDKLSTVKLSSDSLSVGGHSMEIGFVNNSKSDWLKKNVAGQLKLNKRYVLSFSAKKKQNDAKITGIRLLDQGSNTYHNTDLTFADTVDLTPDWKQYRFDVKISTQEALTFASILFINTAGAENIRFDNIKLLEASDTYYLIRDSWKTSDSCNQDLFGNPAPLYMLGCEQYKDRDNNTHNLKSFDKLCQDSAVGCELMIDTHNSTFYGAEDFGTVKVPADNFAYVVYEKSKECRVGDKGCSRFGQYDDLAEAHKDVYLLNNPDRYKDIMCTKDQVGCEAWGLAGGGEAYFKDPGLRACEFRQGAGSSNFDWYKIKANHCVSTKTCTGANDVTTCGTGTGQYCAQVSAGSFVCASKFSCVADSDCSAGTKCQIINTDELCGQTALSTIGLGVHNEKLQPLGMTNKNANGQVIGNAGLCPADQTGCTEYIDPQSSFSYDLLARATNESVTLKPDTLYIVRTGAITEATVNCVGGGMYNIGEDNKLYGPFTGIKTVKQSEEFYIDGALNLNASIGCTVTPFATTELKEAIVNYRIKDSLNKDKPNTVNAGKGQVLFNERSFNGGKYNPLVWDVNKSGVTEEAPQKADAGNQNNSNALLKVDPDRQCATWLGCKSYAENPNKPGDKICYERGLCDQMNDAGECIHFISPAPPVIPPTSAGLPINQLWGANTTNLTGYSKVGYEANKLNADMYNMANMKQEGDTKAKFDGSFENAWETDFVDFENAKTRASVVSDAKVIEKELGFGSYKIIPDGRAVGKTNVFSIKEVNNAGNRQYVVSAYVFLKYGSKVELTVGKNLTDRKTGACPFESVNGSTANLCNGGQYAVVAFTEIAGRWVRLTGSFSISNNYQKTVSGGTERDSRITIGIKPENGLVYFDDVRLEPGLNNRYDNNTSKVKQYVHSDCRLYPESSSMSCDYYDDSGLRKKGWAGYCLEYDPKNPAVCLLWYPIDKVESEEYEGGVALNISKDLYYCVDSQDVCGSGDSKTIPEFFCKAFIKVDKERYWYDRIASGSGYSIPYNLLTNTPNVAPSYFYADFGVNAGGRTQDIVLNQTAGSGYYGAYSSLKPPRNEKLSIGNVGGKIMPFVPYFGWSQAGNDGGNKDRNYFCEATLDGNGHTKPVGVGTCLNNCTNASGGGGDDTNSSHYQQSRPLGKFDNCYVGVALQWNSSDSKVNDDQATCNDYCQWNYLERKCDNGGEPADKWDKIAAYSPFSSDRDCDWARCLATNNQATNEWTGFAQDGCGPAWCDLGGGDAEETGCLFECFNHTKFYRVASDTRSAVQAVKRLFTSIDKSQSQPCYVWNPNDKVYVQSNPEACDSGVNFNFSNIDRPQDGYCVAKTLDHKNIRPEYVNDTFDRDYCKVRPTVPRVELGSSSQYLIKGSGWVAISFSSTVDKQQLPLRKYKIDWDYQNSNSQVTFVRNVNMTALPSIKGGHVVYYFLDYKEMTGNRGNCTKVNPGVSGCPVNAKGQCCLLKPKVILTDNWDATNDFTKNNDPAFGELNNPELDQPIVVYESK